MAGGLTYANTLGAINGINQSGSGVTIPDTFLRWAQDVLFDNNGILRRRSPWNIFKFNASVYPTYFGDTQAYTVTGALYPDPNPIFTTSTVTLTVNNHSFSLGQPVIVSGITPSGYNGSYVITNVTTNTISYSKTGALSAYVSGGSVIANNERVITTISTTNPNGDRITGMVLRAATSARILFYDKTFQGPYISPLTISLDDDNIFDCKQASTRGMWLSFLKSYATGSTSNPYYQYYWRGGCGTETIYKDNASATNPRAAFSGLTGSYGNTLTMTATNNIVPSSGMFVYLNDGINDYYAGTVSSATNNTITLEKDIIRPKASVAASTYFGPSAATTAASGTGTTATLTIGTHNYLIGQRVTIAGVVPAGYNGTYTLTNVTGTTISYASTTTGAQTTPGTVVPSYSVKTFNIRPYIKNHSRGLLSMTTGASATILSGDVGTDGEGHWYSAGINNTWALYRNSDGAWLGDIASVTDNTTIVGSSTYYPAYATAITMTADEYIARPYTTVPSPSVNSNTTSAGVFTAAYAGLQWYGNSGTSSGRNRIVFSNYHNAESVDLSANAADSILIPSLNEMRGLASSSSGLLIFMADKTFILRGNSRFNFSLEELYPEGCLSSMSIVEYGGGVFWASKTGIYYYDGTTVRNLSKDNLGNYYPQSISGFDPTHDRVYGFFYKDYLFMHFTSWKSTFNPVRYEPIYADGVSSTPAISDFTIDDWDPDFTLNDFNLESNTPVYWSYNKMYAGGKSTTAVISSSSNVYQTGYSILSATGNGTNVVFTLSSQPFVVNDSITVSGCTPTGYNGTYTVLSTSGNTFTVANTTTSTLTVKGSVDFSGNTNNSVPAYWGSATSPLLWGPPDAVESFTLAVYLPTEAITVFSNFGFRGAAKVETDNGMLALMGCNIVKGTKVFPRMISVDDIFVADDHYFRSTLTVPLNQDEELIENLGIADSNYYKGPDFFIQTKQYTMGDPLLKKWFRQLFLNLYLIDGSLRLDIVDNEDHDDFNIQKKRHKNWDLFTSISYSWDELESLVLPKLLSPNRSTWGNVEALNIKWFQLTNTAFERRKMRFSWRNANFGFRLYQLNKYRPSYSTQIEQPFSMILESWDIGFKPMRQSRV